MGSRAPAHGQPQLGSLIAAVVHECKELALVDRPRGDLEAIEPHPMARCFVVEEELAVKRGVMAQIDQTARMG